MPPFFESTTRREELPPPSSSTIPIPSSALPLPATEPVETQLFRPGADTSFQIAGWDRSPSDPPLPVNIEDEPDEAKREEAYAKLAKAQAMIHADLTYQFVELVAGLVDAKTDADSYWQGLQQGQGAVEAAFSNLFKEPSEQGLQLTDAERQEIANNMAKELFGPDGKDDRLLDIERLSRLDGVQGLPNSGKKLAEMIEYAKELKELAEALNLGKADASGAVARSGAAAGTSTMFTSASGPAAAALGGFPAKPPGGNYQVLYDNDPAFKITVDDFVAKDGKTPDQARKDAWLVHGARITAEAAAAAPAAPPPSKTFALKVDGKYYDNMQNGKLVLARMMLSKGFSEMQWRAWDVLYNGGKYTQAQLKGRTSRAGIDPSDPVQLEKALRARREILRMFKANQASLQWRRAPENTGIVFLTPKFRAALEKSFADVKNVATVQNVPMIDLMTHAEVRIYFAWLVAVNMATTKALFAPTRVMLAGQHVNIEEVRQGLMRIFQRLYYSGRYLAFAGVTDPLQTSIRHSMEALRDRQFRAMGSRYPSDVMSPSSTAGKSKVLLGVPDLKPFKKPRVQADPRIEARQLASVALMTGRPQGPGY